MEYTKEGKNLVITDTVTTTTKKTLVDLKMQKQMFVAQRDAINLQIDNINTLIQQAVALKVDDNAN